MWSSGSPSAEPRYTSFPADEGAQHVLAPVDAAQPSDTTQRVSQPAVNAAQNSGRLWMGGSRPGLKQLTRSAARCISRVLTLTVNAKFPLTPTWRTFTLAL